MPAVLRYEGSDVHTNPRGTQLLTKSGALEGTEGANIYPVSLSAFLFYTTFPIEFLRFISDIPVAGNNECLLLNLVA